jgi:hypothetical protein
MCFFVRLVAATPKLPPTAALLRQPSQSTRYLKLPRSRSSPSASPESASCGSPGSGFRRRASAETWFAASAKNVSSGRRVGRVRSGGGRSSTSSLMPLHPRGWRASRGSKGRGHARRGFYAGGGQCQAPRNARARMLVWPAPCGLHHTSPGVPCRQDRRHWQRV